MKKNSGKKLFVWLLVLLQLLVCTALAETVVTTITNLTTFNALEQTGNYTVRFLKRTEQPADAEQGTQEGESTDAEPSAQAAVADENVIRTFEDVGYETPISTLMAQLPDDYKNKLWSVTEDYLVLNNVDITVQGDKVARLVCPAFSKDYASLQDAIDAVPEVSSMEDTTVFLLKSTTESVSFANKNFTLDLGGNTLTAEEGKVVLTANGGSLTIQQGTITGGIGELGAGIVISSADFFKADYLTIQENTALFYGAGVYLYNVKDAEMNNCRVTGNKVEYAVGGGIYVQNTNLMGNHLEVYNNSSAGHGGGVYVKNNADHKASLSNDSKIYENTATVSGGGIVIAGGSLYGDGLTISDNTANEGGGIYLDSGIVVGGDGLTINGNEATSKGAGIYAKGTLTGSMTISGNTVTGTGDGAGIYLFSGGVDENGNLTVSGNTIKNGGSLSGRGAGVYMAGGTMNGTLTITGNTIKKANGGNKTYGGAGIYVAEGTVDASMTISGNTGALNGGGMYIKNGTVTLSNKSVIEGHESKTNGGGLYLEKGTLNAADLTIKGNTSKSGSGGGIYVAGGTLNGTGLTVSGNTATRENGGGIYLNGGSLTGNKLNVSENTSANEGGGIYMTNNSTLTANDLEIASNTTTYNGGGIYVNGGTVSGNVKVTGNKTAAELGTKGAGVYVAANGEVNASMTISGNTGAENGGGIYVDGGKVTLSDSHIEKHKVKKSGGGIYLNGGSLTGNTLTVNENTSADEGGGIYMMNNSTLTANDLEIASNTTKFNGGGIFIYEKNTLLGSGLKIHDNTANNIYGGGGGGIYVRNLTSSLIETVLPDGTSVYSNTSKINGGGIYVEKNCTLTAKNLKVTGNTTTHGGGIYVDGGNVALSDSLVEKHETQNSGGGIYLNGGTLTAKDLTVSGNKCASGGGGGIYAIGGTISVVDGFSATVTGNESVDGDGGGLYLTGSLTGGSLNITNNKAAYSGGGAYLIWGGSIKESVLTVSDNEAGTKASANGGGINLYGGSVSALKGSSISGNKCSDGGAGVWMANGSTLTSDNLIISNNTSANNGGGILVQDTNTIEGSGLIVSDNTAKNFWGGGGGIYARNAEVSLPAGTSVNNNHSVNEQNGFCCGGGIYLEGSTLKADGLTVSENNAGGNGGGIFFKEKSDTTKESTLTGTVTVTKNTAKMGGGIYVSTSGILSLKAAQINENTSAECGGGIYASNGIITWPSGEEANGLTIRGNAAINGGGIYMEKGSMTGNTLTVSGNTALNGLGGGIYGNGCTISLADNSSICENQSGTDGGGAYMVGGSLTATSLNVSRNKAILKSVFGGGGGIYTDGCSLNLTGSTFSGNTSGSFEKELWGNGGAIFAKNASITLNGGTFEENYSGKWSNGGGIYASGCSLSATNTSFIGNVARQDGGGIYTKDGLGTSLNACQFSSNKSRGDAGAYVADVSDKTVINECNFTNNIGTRGMASSALRIEGSVPATVTGGSFLGNKGDETGEADAALYVNNSSDSTTISGVTLTGNQSRTVVQTKDGTTFTNCQITGNTLTSNFTESWQSKVQAAAFSMVGGEYTVTLENCNIEGNGVADSSSEYAGAGGIYFATNKLLLKNTTVNGNTGGTCGGIFIDGSGNVEITDRSTITGNKGTLCGGIYNRKGSLKIGENTAVYGNKLGDVPNDLRISPDEVIITIEACEMVDNHTDPVDPEYFKDYYWVDENNDLPKKIINEKNEIEYQKVPNTYGEQRLYVAMPYESKDIAVVKHNDDRPEEVYQSLAQAILEAAENETVYLIYDEENPENNTPVNENVEIDKNLTLDLNGRQIQTQDTAIIVNEGVELSIVGESTESVNSACTTTDNTPAIVNYGTLTIGEGVSVNRIEHRGEALTLDTTGEVGTVYLDKDATVPSEVKVVTVGNSYIASLASSESQPALTFELDSDVLTLLNQGKVYPELPTIVTLMKPAGADTAIPDSLIQKPVGATAAKISVKGVNGYVQLAISKEGNLVACGTQLNGVFVDGQNGKDTKDGLTPVNPVETFKRAQELLVERIAKATSEEEKKAIQGIYVMGTIDVTDSQEWILPAGKMMLRYPEFNGSFADVTGALTLSNIVMDGGSQQLLDATSALVNVKPSATLNINSGAVLQHNRHSSGAQYFEGGGAVYCDRGTVNLNGGTICENESWYGGGICLWDGTLNMDSGSINNNRAVKTNGETPIGGGVALLHRSTMNLRGGDLSQNYSANVGGGIQVGGLRTGSIGRDDFNRTIFNMTGGKVSGNSSEKEGGGIFIQAMATGTISAGSITGNHCYGGFFGGGGIYVNGARNADGDHFGTGKLQLYNVIITDNDANLAGGGLAGCSTSETKIYVTNGGAIYGNRLSAGNASEGRQVYIDSTGLGGNKGTPRTSISAYMLGGGEYKWTGTNGKVLSPAALSNLSGSARLDNPHNDNTPEVQRAKASHPAVWITGNTAVTRGGGIGSNGSVQIGTPPTDGEWTPEATKTLTGRDMTKGEFTFTVKDEKGNVVSTGTNEASADGKSAKIVFTPIPYTSQTPGTKHIYTITENTTNPLPGVKYDSTSFTVNVTVVVGSKSKLTGDVTSIVGGNNTAVAFKNTYKTTPTTAQLKVKKTVQGQPVRPETFTFELALKAGQTNAQYVTMPASTTAKVTGTGNAQFGKITFTKPGDYVFAIKEIPGSASYYQYDKSEWEAAVKVVDDNTVLKATVTYSKTGAQNNNAAEFVNPYTPSAATLRLPVSKTITGATPPSNKTFAFTLTAQNGAPMPKDAQAGISAISIPGAGKAEFGEITYSKAGTYSYEVKEIAGNDTGYTYDTKAYNVTVKVVDLGGRLSASWSVGGQAMEALSFTNTYQPKAVEVKLPVKKEINGSRRPEEKNFTFAIAAVTENAPMPAQNTTAITGAGNAEFGAIRFTQTGTWTYKVSEYDSREQNYVYDNRVYTITVRVTDDNGNLKAAWTTEQGSAEALTFINTYATPTPTPAPTPTPGPEYTTIRVTKQWQDADDADQIRPAYITVYLERRAAGGDYQAVESVRMTGEGNTWTHTFDQLPARNEQGQRYQYRVREDAVDGYAVQYNGYTITNIHVAVTPTPEATPMPTPVVVGPTPPGAKGMRYEDGEWIWIDDLGVPLGVVAQTGDNDNLPAVLGGMAMLFVIAGMLVLMIARKKRKDA